MILQKKKKKTWDDKNLRPEAIERLNSQVEKLEI